MFGLSLIEMQVVLISAIPLMELRFSIPWGLMFGLTIYRTFFLAIIGNFLPIIPLLLLMGPINNLIEKIPFLRNHFLKYLKKIRKKGKKFERYGALGLFLFVAIPIPGTGVYSGAVLAFLLGIRFTYSLLSLSSGMLVAGVIMSLASSGVFSVFKKLSGLEFFLGLLIILAILVFIYWKKKLKIKN